MPSSYRFAIGQQVNLIVSNDRRIPVTVSQTKCINDHRYYLVRDFNVELLEVAEEELEIRKN